jgi:hypothetical protein
MELDVYVDMDVDMHVGMDIDMEKDADVDMDMVDNVMNMDIHWFECGCERQS